MRHCVTSEWATCRVKGGEDWRLACCDKVAVKYYAYLGEERKDKPGLRQDRPMTQARYLAPIDDLLSPLSAQKAHGSNA